MKRYEIELDETIAEFYEVMSSVVNRPVEIVLSDTLFIQAEKLRSIIEKILSIEDA